MTDHTGARPGAEAGGDTPPEAPASSPPPSQDEPHRADGPGAGRRLVGRLTDRLPARLAERVPGRRAARGGAQPEPPTAPMPTPSAAPAPPPRAAQDVAEDGATAPAPTDAPTTPPPAPVEAPAETSARAAARRTRRDLAVAMRQERRRVAPDDQRRARTAALDHRPGVLGGRAGVAAEPTTFVGAVREVVTQVLGLARAVHPRTALVGGVVVGVLAAVSGRPAREALVAGAGVLVTLAVLGLVNDVRDQDRDHANAVRRKPVADGRLPAGNASFAAVCLTVLLVPLSLQNGVLAAVALDAILVVGLVSNLWLSRTWLSWLSWAATFALVPAYLSYGGWGIAVQGAPPTLSVTVLAALLGVAVHFLLSLPHLVADRRSGFRHLPLRIALRIGAPALLAVTVVFTAAVALGLVAGTVSAGLTQ